MVPPPSRTVGPNRRLFGVAIGVSIGVGLLASVQFWLNAHLEGTPLDFPRVVSRQLPSWFTWGLMGPWLWVAAGACPLRGTDATRNLARHALASVVVACLHRPLHVWFAWYPFWGAGSAWDFVRDFTFFSLFTDVAIYWSVVGAKTVLDQREMIRSRDVRAATIARELTEMKLAALEHQLRPHFLFNTLSALQHLQRSGEIEKSTRMVEQLADILRSSLRKDAPAEVTLREELRLAIPYCDLMKIRFGDRVEYAIDVPPDAADCVVPRSILLPLLENAFLHGVERTSDRTELRVVARTAGDRLTLEVHDDGPGPTDSSRRGSGLGVANVRTRLAAHYGSDATFELSPRKNRGTMAHLTLPARVVLSELEVGA